MDFRKVKWSKKQYTLKKIIKMFQLPVIVRAIHGTSGETGDMEISKDEVFRLQQTIQERRVLAYTSYREYSIPVHYGKMVKVIPRKKTSKDSRPGYLTDLFEDEKKLKLPLTVEFVRMPAVLEEPGAKPVIDGPFNLEKLIRKEYVLCNRISISSLDTEVVILPLDVETEVKIAEGLLNGSKSDWTNLMQELNSITEAVNFNLIRGIKDIIIKPLPVYKKQRHQSDSRVSTLPHAHSVVQAEKSWRRRSEPANSISPEAYRPAPRNPHRPPSRHEDLTDLDDIHISRSKVNSYGPPPPYTPRPSKQEPLIPTQQTQLHEESTMETPQTRILNEAFISRPRAQIQEQSRVSIPWTPTRNVDRNSNIPTSSLSNTSISQGTPKSCNRWSSLPDEVGDFSVADVCNSLKLLGIHNYYDIFKENGIDGAKLKTYNLQSMTKELKMRPRDALTLDKLIEKGKPADN